MKQVWAASRMRRICWSRRSGPRLPLPLVSGPAWVVFEKDRCCHVDSPAAGANVRSQLMRMIILTLRERSFAVNMLQCKRLTVASAIEEQLIRLLDTDERRRSYAGSHAQAAGTGAIRN